MAPSDRKRLTRDEGMMFAFTLAAAFAVLSVILAWRQRTVPAEVAFGLAVVLLVAGIVVPTHLGPMERAWMGFGRMLSKLTSPIFLGLVYYVAIVPVGYLRRTIGRSPLARDPSADTFWIPRAPQDAGEHRRAFDRQF